MLTKETINIIGRFTKLTRCLRTVPYDWDEKTKSIKISRSRVQLILFQIGRVHTVFMIIYLTVGFIKGINCQNVDRFTIIWTVVWIIYYLWIALSIHNAIENKLDIIALFNGLKLLNYKFQGNIECNFYNKKISDFSTCNENKKYKSGKKYHFLYTYFFTIFKKKV